MSNRMSVALCAFVVCGVVSTAKAQVSLAPDQARGIIAPFYDALNQPATKDVAALINQSTGEAWVSCGGNDECFPRERVIGAFRSRGQAVPDLAGAIKEVVVAGNRILVRGEATGTPTGPFMGVHPGGKRFRIMSLDVHMVEAGKIVRSYQLEDWAGAIRQLSSN